MSSCHVALRKIKSHLVRYLTQMKVTKPKTLCEHDFLAILHCKKCGEQFHTHWPDALIEAKLDAVAEVLQRTKTTIAMKSHGETKKEAIKIVEQSLQEVKDVYDSTLIKHHKHYRKRIATIR